MDETAPDTALDVLTEMDVRFVSVIWTDDNPFPEVAWGGASAYEALGMLQAAYDKLREDYRIPTRGDDYDDD